MAFNFFTAFHSALQDPKAYFSFQKEMNSKAVEQLFFNSLAGVTVFDAVVLPEDIGSIAVSDGQRAIRVRPLVIHDFIIPEPCSFTNEGIIKTVISLHPVAYPDVIGPYAGGSKINADPQPFDGRVVECFFRIGPQSGGQLRGLTYRPKITTTTTSKINFDCLREGKRKKGVQALFAAGNYKPNDVPKVTKKEHIKNTGLARINYDMDDTIPNKSQHKRYLDNEMHHDFAAYVKLIIAEAWASKKIAVTLASGFRTIGHQKELRDAWDGWIQTLPAEHRSITSKTQWKQAGSPTGKPPPRNIAFRPAQPGSSNHNFGAAADFSIVFNGKSYAGSSTVSEWKQTGFPEIITKYGLRWGGNFSKPDIIHMDLMLGSAVKRKIKDATINITDKNKAIAEIKKINIID